VFLVPALRLGITQGTFIRQPHFGAPEGMLRILSGKPGAVRGPAGRVADEGVSRWDQRAPLNMLTVWGQRAPLNAAPIEV